MRLGLLGGTFDPIHIGHLLIGEEARVRLSLDGVMYVPAGDPYLKADRQITDGHHRMAMVEAAIRDNPHFRASSLELQRPGPTYTLDTLEKLKSIEGPATRIYLILGADAVSDMQRWHRPDAILALARIVGVPRPGQPEVDLAVLDRIKPGASAGATVLDSPKIEISGSRIRARLSRGESVRYWLPEPVAAYIKKHRLYHAAQPTEESHE